MVQCRRGLIVADGVEVEGWCKEGKECWLGGQAVWCRMVMEMVQRVRPQVSGIFSFYSIMRDLFPTRVRRWSCLGGSLPISCGSGVSTKVLVFKVVEIVKGVETPARVVGWW